MVRSIRILCDVCLDQDGSRVNAEETPPITIGNRKPRVLALCDAHHASFYEPFADTLSGLGEIRELKPVPDSPSEARVAPGSTVVLAQPWRCQVEGCSKRKHVYTYRNSFVSHLVRVHGMSARQYVGYYPEAGRLTRSGGDQSKRKRANGE